MMQRFTAYIIEVSDFGQATEVAHRFGDFDTLHKTLLTECPGINLPAMPPKGVDGTDAAVVASRQKELEKLLTAMLASPDVLMEKGLALWKFLNLSNPSVICGRFVAVPRSRHTTLKTLAKLTDPKYKEDVYRLGHAPMCEVLMEALKELRGGDPESGHWCRQSGGRAAICTLLAGALGTTETARSKLIDMDIISQLLGLVERDEGGLDDARSALNVIVARESERFGSLLTNFLQHGGLSQLAVLAQRPKCQEFVAKLLWLAWDAPVRSSFAAPGGNGLRVLQALLRSSTPTCSLLGAVLLAGLVANGDFNSEPAHRNEALKMVYTVLDRPEAASDPQFTKTLCGSNAALVRLASLLDDCDLAPLVLGLLCTTKPPPAKLVRITGNLAGIVSDKTGRHDEITRARAAELLLHIQGSGITPPTGSGQSTEVGSGDVTSDLERCEGIAAHEESLESALRVQLEDGVSKSSASLETQAQSVREAAALAQHRLRPLPKLDFGNFERSFSSYRMTREGLEKVSKESEDLQKDMERQLIELRAAKPSSVDLQSYREGLLSIERLYDEVKTQREALATAQVEAKEKQAKAEASGLELRRATDEVKKYEDEHNSLRLQRSEKDTQATRLRHKANTPSLDALKEQAKASIERNLAQARELQQIGQRVQQGDPDYLKDGETRDSKIAELTAKLNSLKKQQQQLLQQQKDLDFDPVKVGEEAARLESEASELAVRANALEGKRLEAESARTAQAGISSQDADQAKSAQERKSKIAARLAATEDEAKSQLSAMQPMIQEHHMGWQKLLSTQKKLESDQHALATRLEEATQVATKEASARREMVACIQELVQSLQGFSVFLEQVGEEPGSFVPAAAATNEDDFDAFLRENQGPAAPQLVTPPVDL